ncbi:MAG: hypothetical protein D4R97_08745, partial [Bacteroidetes bacterium]
MKPIRIFLLLLIVFLFFGLVSLLVPDHNLTITKDFTVRFPSMKKVFQPGNIEYADIASVLQQKRS